MPPEDTACPGSCARPSFTIAIVAASAVPVVYALSPVPVCLALRAADRPDLWKRLCETLYFPLIYVCENFPLVGEFYEAYGRVSGIS